MRTLKNTQKEHLQVWGGPAKGNIEEAQERDIEWKAPIELTLS